MAATSVSRYAQYCEMNRLTLLMRSSSYGLTISYWSALDAAKSSAIRCSASAIPLPSKSLTANAISFMFSVIAAWSFRMVVSPVVCAVPPKISVGSITRNSSGIARMASSARRIFFPCLAAAIATLAAAP